MAALAVFAFGKTIRHYKYNLPTALGYEVATWVARRRGDALAMGTRELQKNARRRAILDAARALMQDTTRGNFSMPKLAKKAGVSLVTPYNLFGSKSNILLEIARADLFARAAEIASLPADELPDWVAETSHTLARVYHRGRHFYRRLITTLVAQETAEGMREILDLSYHMFEEPLERLQSAGKLQHSVAAWTLAQHLARSVSGSVQHCLMERGSEATLRREIEIGILLLIAGSAGAADRARLFERAAQLDGRRAKVKAPGKPKRGGSIHVGT